MNPTTVISYNKLRQTIGWLGLLLPLIVYVEGKLFCDCALQDSISHYYFTVANAPFVGILWGMGLVLLYYPSPVTDKPNKDGLLTSIAGVCAICVSLFPTTPFSTDSCSIADWEESGLRTGIHYASAGIMLCIFSYMSIKVFTRTYAGNDLSLEKNKWKRKRNRLYKFCGYATFLSILTIGILTVLEKFYGVEVHPKSTFWLEVTALVPFGIAWIVKGGFALTDDDELSTLGKASEMLMRKR